MIFRNVIEVFNLIYNINFSTESLEAYGKKYIINTNNANYYLLLV